jgi:hypothetical protein
MQTGLKTTTAAAAAAAAGHQEQWHQVTSSKGDRNNCSD